MDEEDDEEEDEKDNKVSHATLARNRSKAIPCSVNLLLLSSS